MTYVVGGYRDDDLNPECPRLLIPFTPPASLMFLLGDVFDGHLHQEDPASVPLLTPHAGGGIGPQPLWVVHGVVKFKRACAAVSGRAEWAIVLLVLAGPAPDADETPIPEVVRLVNVPHDPRVALTSLWEGGAVEQGTVVVYEPRGLTTVWSAEFTTTLEAIGVICGCKIHWRPHEVH